MPSSQVSSTPSVVDISDTDSDDAAAAALSRPVADRVASSLLTQDAVDALCRKHGVPTGYTARPAGDRRASTPPPERAVCMYAHALEAGARVPLHGFFSEALTHFGIAPGQLAPSGWRVLVGFVVLCHDAGVQPSTDVFRHFFSLAAFKLKGWYCFRTKDAVGALFTGLSKPDEAWKGRFFFLTSPEPWPCPVRWGEPLLCKNSVADPVLTGQQKKIVGKLLSAHGTMVDLRTYLGDAKKLAAAFASPSPPVPSHDIKGMDSSVAKVKLERDGDTPTVSLKKRKREEAASAKDGLCRSEQSTPHAAPPDFDPKPPHSPAPDVHDGDSADWQAAKKVLESITTPSRAQSFAAAKPSDVVASSYSAMLQVCSSQIVHR
ncbi:uncharacterized protein [Triticum aestivum]|uniref:uncharacterized protein n=1 Tax=Triticum aestivum TaxID=4565 RepID=UPI001D031C76|nr:uncharacterized protein LOC123151976 [Triticum aestivum]